MSSCRLVPILLLSTAAVALAGCAATPARLSPSVNVPAGWSEPAGRPIATTRWWEAMGNAELDGLVKEALAANRDLAIARAHLRQARALADAAGAALLPSVGMQASAARGRETQAFPRTERIAGGFVAGWELDLSGSLTLGRDASAFDALAAAEQASAAEQAIAAEVAAAYVQAGTLRRQVALLDEDVVLVADVLKASEALFAAGRVTRFDVERARTTLAAVRGDLVDRRSKYRAAEQRIAILSGRGPTELRLTFAQFDTMQPLGMPDVLPAAVLERRPDLRARGHALAAAGARVGVALREAYPRVSFRWNPALERLSVVGYDAQRASVSLLGLGITLPVFDGGRIRAGQDAARAAADSALADYEKAMLQALGEVEQAIILRGAAEASLREASEAKRSGEAATETARALYAAGRIDITAVIEAQRARMRAMEAVTLAQGALLEGGIALHRATAGGLGRETTASASLAAAR